MANVKDTIVISCEKCANSVECLIMNPEMCGSSYVHGISTNFDMSREYPDPDVARHEYA